MMAKLNFQESASHDPSEIILKFFVLLLMLKTVVLLKFSVQKVQKNKKWFEM